MLPPFIPEILTGCQNLDAVTLKMSTTQVAETSVTVNNNSPIQDYVHPDDQTQLTFEREVSSKETCFYSYLYCDI